MKEAPGINPFRNDPSREKAERMAASRWARECARFPLFADQVPAPDPDGIVAEYSRKAEDWDRMERRFIQRAHRFWRIVARRVSTERLAELERLRRKLPEDPAYGADFGDGNLSSSLVADRKENRPDNDVAAKFMGHWHLPFHTSVQATTDVPKMGRIRCEEYLAPFARRVAIPQITLIPK